MTLEQNLNISLELWGGFFCLIAALTVFLTRRFDRVGARRLMYVMLCCAALMVHDGLSWFFIERIPENARLISEITNFLILSLGLLVMPLVAQYVSHIIYIRTGGVRIYWSIVEWIIFFIGITALIINQIHPLMYEIDNEGNYISLPIFFAIPGIIIFIGLLMTLSVAIVYIKYLDVIERVAIIVFLILPMLSLSLRIIRRNVAYTNIAIVVSVLIMFIAYEVNYSKYMVLREKQLSDEKLRIINRQMQPHFIFNSLALIRYQCQHSPDEAVATINDFSAVLRRTTDFMGESKCITIQKELDLIEHYLNIQKRRFDDSINVEYDINDTEFDVPPFSVQTLVENALHHGLKDGQTENPLIKISTATQDGEHVVTISDNGVGFDTAILENEDQKHVGITNTKERLAVMCNGRLIIESQPGAGTKVSMIIP